MWIVICRDIKIILGANIITSITSSLKVLITSRCNVSHPPSLTPATGAVHSPVFHNDVHFFPSDPTHYPGLWITSLRLQAATYKQAQTYIDLDWPWVLSLSVLRLTFFLQPDCNFHDKRYSPLYIKSCLMPSAQWKWHTSIKANYFNGSQIQSLEHLDLSPLLWN